MLNSLRCNNINIIQRGCSGLMVYVRACVCVRARLLACVRVRVCMQMTIIPAAVSRCGSFSDNKHWVALVNSVTLSCQHCHLILRYNVRRMNRANLVTVSGLV